MPLTWRDGRALAASLVQQPVAVTHDQRIQSVVSHFMSPDSG